MMRNHWLDKKRFRFQQDFMRAMRQGGSVEIDWEAVDREMGVTPKDEQVFDIPVPEFPKFETPVDWKCPPLNFDIKLPPLVHTCQDFIPAQINVPPIDFPPIININMEGLNIPTEIKLVRPDLPPINITLPPTIPLIVSDKIEPIVIPDTIKVDWGTPPVVYCYVIVRCPGTTDEEYEAFCKKAQEEALNKSKIPITI